MNSARWLDAKALGALVSVREDYLARYVKAGKLPKPSFALGPKQPRWDREELEAFLVERALAAPTGGLIETESAGLPGRTVTRQDRATLMRIWDALGDESRRALLFAANAMAKAEGASPKDRRSSARPASVPS